MLTRIREKLAQEISPALGLDVAKLAKMFEVPKQLDHGHLALPVFFLAKEKRKAPPIIAKEMAEELAALQLSGVSQVVPVGGFLNFHFANEYLQQIVIEKVFHGGSELGHGSKGKGRKLAIDFSSPNVAKPMSIGHLRATVIGQAIVNLAKTQGFEVVAINHLGDWGVQFGKLAWAYKEWGSEYPFAEEPFDSLYKLYVRFHEAAESDKELDAKGSAIFKELEDGDPELQKLWQHFVDISMEEHQKLWDRLGVKHDLVRGESFYNDRLAAVESDLERKSLLVQSEGAMVVDLEADGMPPCLIRKSDGASLYATRDLASAIYRMEDLGANINLYVVGQEQTLHFKQVFKVLEKMGYPWAKDCHHISFGLYRFKDMTKMSSRKGNVIIMKDVLDRSEQMVRKIIEEKNPGLENKELVSKQVGVGAIAFNDLVNDRVKNVDFDWERALDFEGDSGPYVQYCQVRCLSIVRKHGKDPKAEFSCLLESKEERELIKTLLHFESTLETAFQHFKPHLLAAYLLQLCQQFNHFYHKHKVLGGKANVVESRVTLVSCVQKVLEKGLSVLNIESPQAM